MTESLLYYTFITFKLCLKILFRETHSQMMKRRKNLLNRKQFKGWIQTDSAILDRVHTQELAQPRWTDVLLSRSVLFIDDHRIHYWLYSSQILNSSFK